MQPHSPQPTWTQPDWLQQASTWIHFELNRQDITVTGSIEQPHIRPWSTVLRIATTSGIVYFKASAAMLVHEPALTEALSRWQPACMPKILAADLQRGWLLMADGGKRLREVIRIPEDIQHWENLLPIYAELQIKLSSRIQELLAMGIPDRRLAILPALYEQLLADRSVLLINQPGGLTQSEYQRLQNLTGHFAALCSRLLDFPIPESIHHGDFHDGNIFFNHGSYIFFDWGDSSAAHPFFSLRTAFVSIENTLHLEENAPVFKKLGDAYLEPWTRFVSREHLTTAFRIAQRLSPISSALSWHRVLSNLDESYRLDYAQAIPSLLKEFLGFAANSHE